MTTTTEPTNAETANTARREAARRLGKLLRAERERDALLWQEELIESERIWEEITCPTNPIPTR